MRICRTTCVCICCLLNTRLLRPAVAARSPSETPTVPSRSRVSIHPCIIRRFDEGNQAARSRPNNTQIVAFYFFPFSRVSLKCVGALKPAQQPSIEARSAPPRASPTAAAAGVPRRLFFLVLLRLHGLAWVLLLLLAAAAVGSLILPAHSASPTHVCMRLQIRRVPQSTGGARHTHIPSPAPPPRSSLSTLRTPTQAAAFTYSTNN